MPMTKPAEDTGTNYILGLDLVDLFSVAVNLSDDEVHDDAKLFNVYGEISVIDMQGARIKLFEREKDNPVFVLRGGTLPLTVSKDSVISLCSFVQVKVYLWGDNMEIANGSFFVDYTDLKGYDELIVQHVQGKMGYATVHYSKLRCAVFAFLNVELHGFCGDVYGSIDNRKKLLISSTSNFDGKQTSSVLWTVDQSKPVHVTEDGTIIPLSRSVVCVPSFASLVIQANIWDHASGVKLLDEVELEFKSVKRSSSTSEHKPGGHGLTIKVEVDWRHPSVICPGLSRLEKKLLPLQPPPSILSKTEEKLAEIASQKKKRKGKRGKKEMKETTPQISGLTLHGDSCWVCSRPVNVEMVEIFSILVCSYANDCSSVYGKISITDRRNKCCIFEQKEDCPQDLGPLGELPIKWPPIALRYGFDMNLELKDTHGSKISKGYLGYHDPDLDRPISWYDMGLCSVVKGDVGYAVVHHTVFSDAWGARVRVDVCSNGSSNIQAEICGKIVAYYRNYEPKRAYDREFYRRKLFMKLEEDSVSLLCKPREGLNCNPEDALLEAGVAVPKDSPLVIEANLRVSSPNCVSGESDANHAEALQGEVEFEVHSCGSFYKTIQTVNYSIIISVDWYDPRHREPAHCQLCDTRNNGSQNGRSHGSQLYDTRNNGSRNGSTNGPQLCDTRSNGSQSGSSNGYKKGKGGPKNDRV